MPDVPYEWPHVREYRLDLDVDHAELTFRGSVGIVLDGAVSHLRLNALGLTIDPADPGHRLQPHPELEEVWIDLERPASLVTLNFRGRATEKGLIGLYRSTYGDGHILTTQCAATGTRMLYPCIDRPDRKAIVRLRLTIDRDLEAIFNTPARTRSENAGRVTIEFDPTPPMATYLTYLGVGRFDWLRGPEERIRVAVAAPAGRASAGRFAVDRGREIVAAFEQYFGIPYPLPKLDLIAVPEFAYGAMENWGAITFREMRLLVDPSTAVLQRRSSLTTLTHEIAHQWFGNLVTMQWWTDIWLNESFATFLEEKMDEQLYPDALALDDLLLEWTAPALNGDSLPGSHAVSVPVERPEEIGEIFDVISYGKGSGVLRMIEGFLGEAPFRAGVTEYLRRHAYGNATSGELWRSIETASGRPLQTILHDWILRAGVPVVRARLEGGVLRLSQERYSLDGHHTPEHWPIPLGISRGETIERRLFDAPQDSLPLPGNRWVHLNPGALGFYRVHYDDELYRRLREAFPGLPSADRWSILQDLFSFLLSGDASRDLYYGFLDASRQANEHLIVHEIANQLSSTIPGRHPTALGALLGDEPDFRRHALLWLSSEMARLGLAERAGEPEVAAVLRGRVASSLAPLDRDFARGLARRYAEYRSVAPDLRWPVLFSYASLGGASEHDELLRALRAAPDEGDALRLERSLARFPDPALVARTLDLALAPPFNRAHLQAVVREAALNPAGRTAVWEWIRSTMHTVEPEYKGTSVIADILKFALPYAALGRRSEAEAELSERPFAEGKRGALEGLAMLGIYERFLAGGG